MDDIHSSHTTTPTRDPAAAHRHRDLNKDPITGEPGSHPVGTGAGSAAGGAAGMAVGALGGPVGALVGGVIGAIAGGAGGHAVAERLDPTAEEAYWRDNYRHRPYASGDRTFDDYAPAYRYGHEAAVRTHDRPWEDVEGDLRSGWTEHRGDRDLDWNEASPAVRDAWYRTGSHFRDWDEDDAYWRNVHSTRDYYDDSYSYDDDYAPAYRYGATAHDRHRDRDWDDRLESELREGWAKTKGKSRLGWEKAKHAVKDAWYRATGRSEYVDAHDHTWRDRHAKRDDLVAGTTYDDDYRSAYRYGYDARRRDTGRDWDDRVEGDLERGWDNARGRSRLAWQQAKSAVREGWHSVERRLPGDADRDGR